MNENKNKKEKRTFTNYDIFPGKIKLVGENGVEVIDRDEGISRAKVERKSLVQVAYSKTSFPRSTCKIMDIGKLKYEQKKKEKEQSRKNRMSNSMLKEVFFSIRIDENDKNTKINHIMEFLSEKNRVKINIKLMRREMHLMSMAKDLMKEILGRLEDMAEMDGTPSINSSIVSCTVKKKP